jgi:hypothetical protein
MPRRRAKVPLVLRNIAGLLIAILPLIAAAENAESKQCGIRNSRAGTVFSLSIGRSRQLSFRHTEFWLCERTEPGTSFLLVNSEEGHNHKLDVKKRIVLDETRFVELAALFHSALDVNLKDDTIGMDGSTWCLQARPSYSVDFKACFWSPPYSEANRGISGLANLGRNLWHLADFEPEVGNLY